MGAAQTSYDSCMAKANAQLEEQDKKYKEDADALSKAEHEALVKDHPKKLEFEQDRFTKK